MKMLLTLSLLFGTCLAAFAEDDGKGKGKGKRTIGDPAAAFKKLDANSDNKVSKDEFSKFRENLPEKIKEKSNGKGGQLFDRFFDIADDNKDGYLTLDEFKKMREKISARLKKGKNGT